MSRKEKTAGYFIFGLFIMSLLLETLELVACLDESEGFRCFQVSRILTIRSLYISVIYRISTILMGVFCLPSFTEKRRLLRISILISAVFFALSEVYSFKIFQDTYRSDMSMGRTTFFFIENVDILYFILMTALMVLLFLYYRAEIVKRVVLTVVYFFTFFFSVLQWDIHINPREVSDVWYLPVKLSGLNVLVYSAAIFLIIIFIRPGQKTFSKSTAGLID